MFFLKAYMEETSALLSRATSFRRLAISGYCRIINILIMESSSLIPAPDGSDSTAGETPAELTAHRAFDLLNETFSALLGLPYAKDVPQAVTEQLYDLSLGLARHSMLKSACVVMAFLQRHAMLLQQNDLYSASLAGIVNFECPTCKVRHFGPQWCVINTEHDPDLGDLAAAGRLYSPDCPQCRQPSESTREAVAPPPEPFAGLFLSGVLLYHNANKGDYYLAVMSPEEGRDHRFYGQVAMHFIERYQADLPPNQRPGPGSFRLHVFLELLQFESALRTIREDPSVNAEENVYLGGLANSVVGGSLTLESAKAAIRRAVVASPDRFASNLLVGTDAGAPPRRAYVVASLMREVAVAMRQQDLIVASSIELAGWAQVIGEAEEAIEVLRSALTTSLAEREGDPRHHTATAIIATRLSLLYLEIAASGHALEFADLALECSDENTAEDGPTFELVERLNILGCILRETDSARAIRVLYSADEKLLSAADDTDDSEQLSQMKSLHSAILNNIALTHTHAAFFLDSDDRLSPKQVESLRHLYPRSDPGVARTQLALFMRSEAERLLKEAVQISREQGHIQYLSRQLTNLAAWYHSAGHPELALPLNQESVSLAGKTNFPTERADAMVALASTELALALTTEAVSHAEEAIDEFEDHYFTQVGLGYRKRLGLFLARAFDILVRGKYDLADGPGTLAAISHSKARTLNERVDLQGIQPEDPDVAIRYRESLLELRRLEAAVWQSQPDFLRSDDVPTLTPASFLSPPRQASAEDFGQLKSLQAVLSSYRKELALTDPRYGLLYGRRGADIHAGISAVLREGQVLLELYLTEDHTICVLVDRRGVSFRQIPGGRRAWLSGLQDAWFRPLETQLRPGSRTEEERRKAWHSWMICLASIGEYLGHWLWPHLEEMIQARAVRHLIIAPHHVLHLMPLHLMQTSRQRMLCEEMYVSYVPSAQTLLHLQRLPVRRGSKVVAVSHQTRDPRKAIPFSRFEVDAIAGIPGLMVQRAEAGDLRSGPVIAAMGVSDVLHFGCHGRFDGDNVLGSLLELSDTDSLGFGEIAGSLRVAPGATAVLSACETGRVLVDSAEEYLGLPYAFLCAGCGTVVSSLWRVMDQSTALLMIRFYEALANGVPKLESLHAAQAWVRAATNREIDSFTEGRQQSVHVLDAAELERIRAAAADCPGERPFANPVYWAGFTLLGNWE